MRSSPLSVALADNQFGITTTSVTPTGELKVANPPTQLFNDTFDTPGAVRVRHAQ